MKNMKKIKLDILNKNSKSTLDEVNKLLKIMELLRDPNEGCPWDIKQNFSSIAPHTIEEAYEVSNAIEQKDYNELKNELGDLLLQVIFHSQIAKEKNLFNFDDVIKSINQKLIRRHPHIFKNIKDINNEIDVKQQWDKIKEKERGNDKSLKSDLGGITQNIPSILKAQKLQERASLYGFDWLRIEDTIEKLNEEIQELKEVYESNNNKRILDESGDLLFSAINIVRKLNISADQALSHANQKFITRYQKSEELSKNEKEIFSKLSLEKKNIYWEKSKNILND